LEGGDITEFMDIREFDYGDKVELPDDFQEPCDPFL